MYEICYARARPEEPVAHGGHEGAVVVVGSGAQKYQILTANGNIASQMRYKLLPW